MPEIGLIIWDHGRNTPTMSEANFAIVPRVGDFLEFADPQAKRAVWRVFAVVVAHEGGELAADVHVEQASESGVASVSYIQSLRTKSPKNS